MNLPDLVSWKQSTFKDNDLDTIISLTETMFTCKISWFVYCTLFMRISTVLRQQHDVCFILKGSALVLWLYIIEVRRASSASVLRATHTHTPPLSLICLVSGINCMSVFTPYIKANNKSLPYPCCGCTFCWLYQPLPYSPLFPICVVVAASVLMLCPISVHFCRLPL